MSKYRKLASYYLAMIVMALVLVCGVVWMGENVFHLYGILFGGVAGILSALCSYILIGWWGLFREQTRQLRRLMHYDQNPPKKYDRVNIDWERW